MYTESPPCRKKKSHGSIAATHTLTKDNSLRHFAICPVFANKKAGAFQPLIILSDHTSHYQSVHHQLCPAPVKAAIGQPDYRWIAMIS